jgi:hypothetical protein
MNEKFPRLSLTLIGEKHPLKCQSCGSAETLSIWEERNDDDSRSPIGVIICKKCSDKLIEPHPRLYYEWSILAPFPGCMKTCVDCALRDGVTCTSGELTWRGGSGLRLTYPQPTIAFVDGRNPKTGKRFGGQQTIFHGDPKCDGKKPTAEK